MKHTIVFALKFLITFSFNIIKQLYLSNGIKAITSDFGSEDLGSIPGQTTRSY